MRSGGRILAIGVDAGEPVWIERWMEEGVLPTISKIAETGCFGRLRSVADAFSDAVWPTFYTGAGPATHGYYHFRQVRPGSVRLVPTMNQSYKRPFWALLQPLGKRVVTFDVPKAPLDAEAADCEVVGWGEHFGFVHGSRPAGLFREIERRFGRHPHTREVPHPRNVRREQRILRKILSAAERRAEAIRFLMSQTDWDLFIAVFSETHGAGHQFYQYLDPASPGYDARRARVLDGAVRECYIAVDRAIAAILELAPDDTDVILFSAHGIETQYATRSLMQDALVRLGYQVPRPRRGSDPLRLLRDHLPLSLRDQINHLLPISVQSALIARFSEGAWDWSRTRAVAEDSREHDPWVRINLRGREPWGIVEPGRTYDALCEELTRDLMALTVHPGGQRAVREVWRTDQVFRGAHVRELPDLIVHWGRGTAIRALEHPRAGLITGDLPMIHQSQHTPRAFLAAAGPRVRPGARPVDGRLTDLAPTFLYLTGAPIAPDIEGRVLTELIREEFLAGHPIVTGETSLDVGR